ncbi:hypothetical protein BST22_02055 [Mycolicibacterium chubuense]|uniref:Uncharacterized protein n=1 Tax=Mycolicibacterium chubuense TaxID=1800 RepID=A0A0J6VUY1_MYCCU|nr:hypothetical protein [Mycolicibacterium chubuense]KMO73278.1 hypothetical protein MCHUDSM44219_04456 [Mycolicibacterium chubuense]ORA56859.1 hypothetical protein BST22_02055 [Mycolicibacterium chubuense]SPX98813.1 Uncharacterised protein [Mycolicibacterium chubuense]
MRWILLFTGVAAMLVGGVGLLTPVSVDPRRVVVSCGTAVSPDMPVPPGDDDAAVDPDYARLCRMEVTDRRLWTITLLVVGATTTAAGVAYARRRAQAASNRLR